MNKGYVLQHGGNASGATKTTEIHYHNYCTSGRREYYSNWALSEMMRYTQVYTEAGIPNIWGNFQMSKECAYNRQELLAGMMYWAKKNGTEIDTAVLFVKLVIEEMVKTKIQPGRPGGNV